MFFFAKSSIYERNTHILFPSHLMMCVVFGTLAAINLILIAYRFVFV